MKSVVICGSRRFEKGIRNFAQGLRQLKVVVHEPYLHHGKQEWEELSESYKNFILLGLTHDHFNKIRLAEVVYIYNQDGYVGNNTTLEIGVAVQANKPIYALSADTTERARNILFRPEHPATPEELFKFL